jgi:hypothetical protein
VLEAAVEPKLFSIPVTCCVVPAAYIEIWLLFTVALALVEDAFNQIPLNTAK